MIAALWAIAGTRPEEMYGDTLNSRLATVYALVHKGTFTIKTPGRPVTNPLTELTVDKVEFNGVIVSSKPPVLPLLMTAEYLILKPLFGWRLDEPDDVARIAWLMTLTFVGAPFVLMVWALVRTVQIESGGIAPAAFAGLAALLGTHASAYAITMNNHVPAAAAVMGCFALSLAILRGHAKPSPRNFALFGLAAGIAVTVDVPTAVFPALLGLLLARRHLRSLLVWAVPVAALLVAVQSIALFLATGSPLPAQLHPDAYLFENSYWRNPLGVDAINDPFATYLFHITLGRVGIFSLFPITLLAVPGILWVRRASRSFLGVSMCGVLGSVVLALYYASSTNNYGGSAFGFRWFIVLGPVLLLLSTPAIASFRRPWHWAVPAVLLAVSAYSAFSCARDPWRPNQEWTARFFDPGL